MPQENGVSTKTPAQVVNQLIEGLPRRERNRILDCCEPVDLVFGTVLCEPDRPYRHVYFPLSGFVSLVATVGGHQPLEMRLIGNEGMLGVTLVLGVNTTPLRGVVQGSGTALRMSTGKFRRELGGCPVLLRTLHRYLYVLMAQLSQVAGCNRFHEVQSRLAYWLLMTHDRAHADHFHLTHEFLADMLGVQRSAVTIAAGTLQKKKLISYTRGEIRVLSRSGLEAASCECYDAVIQDYAQLLA
jgi:CRP-like cAMP-binding protein